MSPQHPDKDGSLPNPKPGPERERYIHEHDCPRIWEFWRKYALGSKLCPSCLLCGKPEHDPARWAIRHAELPDIYICKACVDAARTPVTAAASIDQRLERLALRAAEGRLNPDEHVDAAARLGSALLKAITPPVAASIASVAIRSIESRNGRYVIEYGDGNTCDFRDFKELASFIAERDQAAWAMVERATPSAAQHSSAGLDIRRLQDIAAEHFPESVELGERCLRAMRQAMQSAGASIAQVLPLQPQPETVTKATHDHAAGYTYTIPGPWAPEGFQTFDCHYNGDIMVCDKDCVRLGYCKRRGTAPSSGASIEKDGR